MDLTVSTWNEERFLMPAFDSEQNEFIFRILYDGPPNAGKTTNLRHLFNLIPTPGRASINNPGPESDCTLYFGRRGRKMSGRTSSPVRCCTARCDQPEGCTV